MTTIIIAFAIVGLVTPILVLYFVRNVVIEEDEERKCFHAQADERRFGPMSSRRK